MLRPSRATWRGLFGMIEKVFPRPWPMRLAAAAGTVMVALGLTVLVGWLSHTPALIQLRPELAPMTRNAAASFVMCGLALVMVALKSPRGPVVGCAGTASGLSVLTIVEYIFRLDVGINELLGPAYITGTLASPGRMAPVPTTCFALGSMGLLLAPKIPTKRSAFLLGLNGSVIAAMGVATCMALTLRSSDLVGGGHGTRVGLHTAIGLGVFGLGIVALAWHLETDAATTPRWLPISAAIAVATGTVGVWQALIAAGFGLLAPLPAVVLGGGCLMALIFGWTVYLAQRVQAQREGRGPTSAPTDAELRRANDLMVMRPLVSVVDDDESVRESLPDLLRELGYAVQAFASAEEFLASRYVEQTRCLILDIAMPGMSGLDLQRELKQGPHDIPIVFITAHLDETVRPRALELGAVECLFKPFTEGDLIAALDAALA